VGHAAAAWDKLQSMLTSGDFDDVTEVYGPDAIYLESLNPPHNGNLLVQAYMKDFYAQKANVAVAVKRVAEAADGRTIAIEWTLSYDAAGRRWNDLPRATFLEVGDAGEVSYQRDYA